MFLADIVYSIFLVIMIAQSIATVFLNLYGWSNPDILEKIKGFQKYSKPKKRFSIFLPAYHEEAVQGQTIAEVAKLNYPKELFEILVILQPSDKATIKVSRQSIKKNKISNAKVLIVDGKHSPLNKPYQLNYALKHAKYEHIVIFDSEDQVSQDILKIANTHILRKKTDVLQCGVQLMNYDSNWFSSHNVLEYYFWFKSRMHVHIKLGTVPLGGNTVFFRTSQIKEIGGWNENCLTEDAELGIRLSKIGAKFDAVYDPQHITKEETPHTVKEFIKQRTRWVQGFIQILKDDQWRSLPYRKQIYMCWYLLGFPVLQSVLFFASPLLILVGLVIELPLLLSMFSFLPMILVLVLIAVQINGLYEFVKEQHLPMKLRPFLLFIPTFLPYQIIMNYGAIRALYRELKGLKNWEKTTHTGLHKQPHSNPINAVSVGINK